MVRISIERLLQLLEQNGRQSYVNLAKEFGTTEAAIRKRVRQLEEQGVITGYRAEFDAKKANLGIHVEIGVDTTPEGYISVIERVKKLPDVIRAWRATGDHMLIIEARFADSNTLNTFVKELEKMRGVTKTCPMILLERLK